MYYPVPTPSQKLHPPGEFTLKEKIQYSLLGLLVAGGAFYLGRKLVRNIITNAEEKNTYKQGNPAMFAQQIKMAFENDGWPGTNMAALRNAIQTIPSVAEFKKVINSYQRLNHSSLMEDLKGELKSTEYNEMLAILAAKPKAGTAAVPVTLNIQQYQSWAQRLKNAFDIEYGPFPGTDEKAIKAVFMEIPNQAAFNQLAAVYKRFYGNDLTADLKSELEFWEYSTYMKLITDKPQS
jgi:hypothetical protein